jgi:indole-3-acetate monooxygenase
LRARLRAAATHLVRTSADVVRSAYDMAGGTAVYSIHPLQRRLRDAHVATQHMMVGPSTWELTGRVLLGLPTDDMAL